MQQHPNLLKNTNLLEVHAQVTNRADSPDALRFCIDAKRAKIRITDLGKAKSISDSNLMQNVFFPRRD